MKQHKQYANMMSQVQHIARDDIDVFALARLLVSHGTQVHFAHDSGLQRARSDVSALTWHDGAHGSPALAHLVSTHLGLTGATSPLPQEALAALEEATASDTGGALTAWLAHLHNRLLELLHDGVNRAQPATCATTTLDDPMSTQLLMGSAHSADLLPRALRLGAHAVLSKPCCTADDVAWAVGTALSFHGLGCAVQCLPMTGGMLPLGEGSMWELGRTGGALGTGSVLGHSAVTPTARVRLRVGPVNASWVALCVADEATVASHVQGMVQAVLPEAVEADIELVLQKEALEPLQLRAHTQSIGRRHPFAGLGANVFLGAPPAAQAVPWAMPGATRADSSHPQPRSSRANRDDSKTHTKSENFGAHDA